ncbi:helix-turn-helix domain-containing protein [unidentified bacterial endosymbiont]|uniref:helix-turn-helix domain-containing protein n=1 Tax=unidentified bacterial endosymbiont TaxID=2355 RepID=UPI00209E114F|nr:helix-turn-helix domain-containing protein [unidentified bacterial endosymbiont]
MNLHEINKQTDRIEKLLALFPVSRPFLLESGKVLNIKEKNDSMQERIYFLLDGAMIGSVGEGEKKQNLGITTSPYILGLGQLGQTGLICDFESVAPCLLDSVEIDVFRKAVDDNNMWSDVVQIMLPALATLAVRASTSGLQSAYEIIRSYLIYMELETSYAIKERYTVVKYMQTFSRLSRSMILKILAQLKIGGFIEMENGKLIKINKKLPEKF